MNQQPIVMSDARFISNYIPNAMFETQFKASANVASNEDYRHYLVNNATGIMKYNKKNALQQNVVKEFYKTPYTNNGPYLFDNVQSQAQPKGFETNDAKQQYLSRIQLADLRVNQYKKVNI
tara:strand:+ start:957 stop:1319 length:363 start_codon:yes stop_codon:yes gene_type:complete